MLRMRGKFSSGDEPNLFLLLKSACHQVTTRAAAEAEREAGVHGAQALALIALAEAGDRTLTELAALIDTKLSAAATLLQRLEREGLAQRRPSDEDARAVVVSLTEKGAAAAEAAKAMIAQFDARLRRGFDEAEMAVVLRFLAAAGEAI